MKRRLISRRHSRRTILSWLLVFVTVQIAFSLALEGPLAKIRNPDYAGRSQILKDRISEAPERPAIVVIGTSRTMYGLCPAALVDESCDDASRPLLLNMGMPGHGPMHEAIILERVLRDGIRPAAVVIEIIPAWLSWDPANGDPISLIRHGWRDLPGLAEMKQEPDRPYREWLEARFLPCFYYRYNVMHHYASGWLPNSQRFVYWSKGLDRWGWYRPPQTRHDPRALAGCSAPFANWLRNFRIAPAHDRGLRRMLEVCQRERLPATLLFMPESPQFRAVYTPDATAQVQKYFTQVQKEFSVPLIDAREWFDSEELFVDGHHLLPDGARQFTLRLAREVRWLPESNPQSRSVSNVCR